MRNTSVKFIFLLFLLGCKKEETVIFTDNNIPNYAGIPTIVVNNYVNRVFIDVLGREPLDAEMTSETQSLRNDNLSKEARKSLVLRLMTDETFVQGDISYNHAYYGKLYEDLKARFLDGASDANIESERGIALFGAQVDSVNGNWPGYQINKTIADKLMLVLQSKEEYRTGVIGIREVCRRMLDNSIYDLINMNTFNFVNALFDDLFFRFPTEIEFSAAYEVVENNQPAVVLGEVVQNKGALINVMVQTTEFDEGTVRWVYLSLLARETITEEVFILAPEFKINSDLNAVQLHVLITDEYAGFD